MDYVHFLFLLFGQNNKIILTISPSDKRDQVEK